MYSRRPSRLLLPILLPALLVVGATGCDRDDDPLTPAPLPEDAVVFDDNLASGVDFQAFAGSKADALERDTSERFEGQASLRISVPAPDDPGGSYAGGAFVASVPRDLTQYNALVFWARADQTATLNVAGLGNDNTGTSLFTAETQNLPLTTEWRQYVIPIPDPAALQEERGLFYFAEGGEPYTIWMDAIRFETVSGLGAPRPAIATQSLGLEVGSTASVTGTQAAWTVGGEEIVVTAAPSYFTFTSSDPAVATVSELGEIEVVGEGTATITASLGSVDAAGVVTVTTVAGPTEAAPIPTRDGADVISLFSSAFDDVPVDTWRTEWSDPNTTYSEIEIDGRSVKRYGSLVFAGIEFVTEQIDASEMTHFHMHVWTPDNTDRPNRLGIKLVDFGADGQFDTGVVEGELFFDSETTPTLESGTWVSLEIPLADFQGLVTRENLAQLIISGVEGVNTVYVDNVYFFRADDEGDDPEPTPSPTEAAPTPTQDAADVISLFSNAYENVAVDRWTTDWDNTSYEEIQIGESDVKRYSNLVFAGIEFVTEQIDVSEMTHFHMHVWTPDTTDRPNRLAIKLVDFGADGQFDTGVVEDELFFDSETTPALESGTWVSLEMPLADFQGLVTRENLAQLIISGVEGINTVYVDNVYFFRR